MMHLPGRLARYDFKTPYDLIIIGGGINGAGLARDASDRGYKVLLLEKRDFASGCSAHSTRLVHGGLRYLEYLEFNLVYESLQEREVLLRNYPHLVRPINLKIPTYKHSKNSALKMALGMTLYDMLSWGKSLPGFGYLSHDNALAEMNVNTKGFKSAVSYYDAQVSFAERLCLENILTAEKSGATCFNYTEVSEVNFEYRDGKYWAESVKFKDLLDLKTTYTASARHIVNLSGPWVDGVNMLCKDKQTSFKIESKIKRIGGTKGSHIIVEDFIGAPEKFGVYTEAKSDGRPFFILPYKLGMNKTLYLIGTTDIYLSEEEDLDALTASEPEIDYLLKETNNLFPQANLSKKSVIKTYVGVRPLPAAREGQCEGAVTRSHVIDEHKPEGFENYYSVIGGKLTTFRSLAKDIADLICRRDRSEKPCLTDTKKTIYSNFGKNSGDDYLEVLAAKLLEAYSDEEELKLVDEKTIFHLIKLYGTEAEAVLKLCEAEPKLANKLHRDFEDIQAQVVYAIRKEKAITIDDILNRRLTIGLSLDLEFVPSDILEIIADHLATELKLDRRDREALVPDFVKTGGSFSVFKAPKTLS